MTEQQKELIIPQLEKLVGERLKTLKIIDNIQGKHRPFPNIEGILSAQNIDLDYQNLEIARYGHSFENGTHILKNVQWAVPYRAVKDGHIRVFNKPDKLIWGIIEEIQFATKYDEGTGEPTVSLKNNFSSSEFNIG